MDVETKTVDRAFNNFLELGPYHSNPLVISSIRNDDTTKESNSMHSSGNTIVISDPMGIPIISDPMDIPIISNPTGVTIISDPSGIHVTNKQTGMNQCHWDQCQAVLYSY